MKTEECTAFLRWALPCLQLRWEGFRRVRRRVCRRIQRRLRDLGLPDAEAYRAYLATHPDEWGWLDTACRIPISRFHRNRGVFDCLATSVLPLLAERAQAAGQDELRCWSAGCASGEEPYSLALIWWLQLRQRFPDLSLRVMATDVDANLLERARQARYGPSSLKDLPPAWIQGFTRCDGFFCLREELRKGVEFRTQDIRRDTPPERFHLILCRNLAFTYFDLDLQRRTASRLRERLEPGGVLLLGSHERLPRDSEGFAGLEGTAGLYERTAQPRTQRRCTALDP